MSVTAVSRDGNSVISAILTVCPIFLRVGELDSRTMSSGERGSQREHLHTVDTCHTDEHNLHNQEVQCLLYWCFGKILFRFWSTLKNRSIRVLNIDRSQVARLTRKWDCLYFGPILDVRRLLWPPGETGIHNFYEWLWTNQCHNE